MHLKQRNRQNPKGTIQSGQGTQNVSITYSTPGIYQVEYSAIAVNAPGRGSGVTKTTDVIVGGTTAIINSLTCNPSDMYHLRCSADVTVTPSNSSVYYSWHQVNPDGRVHDYISSTPITIFQPMNGTGTLTLTIGNKTKSTTFDSSGVIPVPELPPEAR